MKQICVFLGFLMLMSCEYFNVKKTSSDAILKEELQTFNWNEVDEYPSFSECDSYITKQERKQCFENTLSSYIFRHLSKQNIIVSEEIDDTLKMKIEISDQGILKVLSIENSKIIQKQIPNIETLLIASFDSLPKVYPAIKRGQHVKTQFELPVIIKVN
jgi:hypothetical protein